MDFNLTDEQELLLESVDEFCERYFDEETVKGMYENHGIPQEILEAYRDAGFGLMGVPEEYGGVPCDCLTLGLMIERFFYKAGCMSSFMTNTLTLFDIVEFGTPELIQMAVDAYNETGKPLVVVVASEPGAGSDNQSMTTVAKKQPDGTYLLNGQKTWVTDGQKAPYLLVVAKDEDPSRENKSMSMWLVKADAPGVSMLALTKIGQQSIPFCDIFFEDVVLTEDMRLGEPGRGFHMLMKNFEFERCLIVAESLGLAQAAMDDAAAYSNDRIAFGKPISNFQLIQEMLTEMEIILQNTRNMLYKTLWKLDNDQSIRLDSALLKRYAVKNCTKVADMALEIYGGLGYTTETRVGRLWTDLRGNELAGGTNEIMVHIAGRQVAKKYAR